MRSFLFFSPNLTMSCGSLATKRKIGLHCFKEYFIIWLSHFFNTDFVDGHLGHLQFRAINNEMKHAALHLQDTHPACSDGCFYSLVAWLGVEMTKAHVRPLHAHGLL